MLGPGVLLTLAEGGAIKKLLMLGHGVLLTLAKGETIKTPYIWPWGTFDPGRRRDN